MCIEYILLGGKFLVVILFVVVVVCILFCFSFLSKILHKINLFQSWRLNIYHKYLRANIKDMSFYLNLVLCKSSKYYFFVIANWYIWFVFFIHLLHNSTSDTGGFFICLILFCVYFLFFLVSCFCFLFLIS